MLGCIKFMYANEVIAVSDFDSKKYLGVWHEIARLPNRFENKCVAPITAHYSIDPNNHSQLIVTNKCNTRNNSQNSVTGVVYFVEASNIGKLKVTFLPKFLRWLPFGYGDYWILSVDYEGLAVVGEPSHKYLWILSRSPEVSKYQLESAITVAKDQGFETTKLIFNNKFPTK